MKQTENGISKTGDGVPKTGDAVSSKGGSANPKKENHVHKKKMNGGPKKAGSGPKKENSISFQMDDGKEVRFFVLEETMLAGENYLLVSDRMGDEATAYIMHEITEENEERIYEILEDEKKIEVLSKVFSELMDNVEFR